MKPIHIRKNTNTHTSTYTHTLTYIDRCLQNKCIHMSLKHMCICIKVKKNVSLNIRT